MKPVYFIFITEFCNGKNRDFILNVNDYIFLTSIFYNTKDTHPYNIVNFPTKHNTANIFAWAIYGMSDMRLLSGLS